MLKWFPDGCKLNSSIEWPFRICSFSQTIINSGLIGFTLIDLILKYQKLRSLFTLLFRSQRWRCQSCQIQFQPFRLAENKHKYAFISLTEINLRVREHSGSHRTGGLNSWRGFPRRRYEVLNFKWLSVKRIISNRRIRWEFLLRLLWAMLVLYLPVFERRFSDSHDWTVLWVGWLDGFLFEKAF